MIERQKLIEDLQGLLHEMKVPEEEAPAVGLVRHTGLETLRMLKEGQAVPISRRYLISIIHHLMETVL